MNNTRNIKNENPRESANFLSILTFSWYVKLCSKGLKRHLQFRDLYANLSCDKSTKLGDRLEKYWNEEVEKAKKRFQNPSVRNALRKTLFRYFMFCGILQFFQYGILLPIQPILLSNFLLLFSAIGTEKISILTSQMFYIGGQMIVLSFILAFFRNHLTLAFNQLGMSIKIACSHLIYKKILRLNQTSIKHPKAKEVFDIISTDLRKFDNFLPYYHYVWIVPIQTVIVTALIWSKIGVAALIGVSVFLLLTLPVNGLFSIITSLLQKKVDAKTDERLAKVDEIVTEIHVIKTNGWEKPFEEKVEKIRKQEIRLLTFISYVKGIITSTTVFLQKAILFLTAMLCLLFGVPLAADNVFPLLQFYSIMQQSLIIDLPSALDYVSQSKKILNRLGEFLVLEEKFQPAIVRTTFKSISLKGVDASWTPEKKTLVDLNFKISEGTLCVIVGLKDAGKTSLLQLLLGELTQERGDIKIGGEISYAAQKPWIFTSTIRHNIIFGQEYNETLFKAVVQVCGLEEDLNGLEKKDETLVGIGECSLNSGQRARITLARAVYRKADIYLLDDCVTQMSSKKQNFVFTECILEYLKNKTRIIVTHQLEQVLKADLVFVLENGKIRAQGTYEELQKLNINFKDLLKESQDETAITDDVFSFTASMSLLSSENPSDLSSIDMDTSDDECESKVFEESTGKSSYKIENVCSICTYLYSKISNFFSSLMQKSEEDKDKILPSDKDLKSETLAKIRSKPSLLKIALPKPFNSEDKSSTETPTSQDENSGSESSSKKGKKITLVDSPVPSSSSTKDGRKWEFPKTFETDGHSSKTLTPPTKEGTQWSFSMSTIKRQISQISNISSSSHHSQISDIESSSKKELGEMEEEAEKTFESITTKIPGGTNYMEYIKSGASFWHIIKLILLILLAQLVTSLADYWLTIWTKEQSTPNFDCFVTSKPDVDVINISGLKIINIIPNGNGLNFNGSSGTCASTIGSKLPLYIYTFLIILSVILLIWRTIYYYKIAMAASEHLHSQMLNSLIESPVSYFDENSPKQEISVEKDEPDEETEQSSATSSFPTTQESSNEDDNSSVQEDEKQSSNRSTETSNKETEDEKIDELDKEMSQEESLDGDKTRSKLVTNFSKDMDEVDNKLPNSLLETLQGSLLSIGMFILIIVTNPYMIIITILLGFALYKVRTWLLAIGQDLKILENKLKYPLLMHISDTLNGLLTVRATGIQNTLLDEFHDFQDNHTAAWYLSLVCAAAFGFWIDILSTIYITCTILSFILLAQFGPVNSSYVGLAITQSLILSGTVHYATKSSLKTAENMATTKKVLDVTKLDKEGVFITPEENKPELAWPYGGSIKFIDVSLRYSKFSKRALKNVNFDVEGGQKIGIVGESGAGKTSLLNAILKFAIIEGSIIIDGKDTSTVGLRDLRRKVSLIPQKPVLFSDTLRFNLDPLLQYTDQAIWQALEMVQLKNDFYSLNYIIKNKGKKISTSKKQLLCLARAILRNNKILLLDNALENVDKRTDSLIMNVVRTKFATATVFIIAHNLDTVIDSDRIMVMNDGVLVEYDYPHELLSNKKGHFAKMVANTGSDKSTELRNLAEDAFMDNVIEIQESITEVEEIIILL